MDYDDAPEPGDRNLDAWIAGTKRIEQRLAETTARADHLQSEVERLRAELLAHATARADRMEAALRRVLEAAPCLANEAVGMSAEQADAETEATMNEAAEGKKGME